jgi:hypothetical protein
MADNTSLPDTAPQGAGAPSLHGAQVWVLSEESPFDDPEGSGGCVCGVFASAAAALFELGTWQIDAEELAQIRWTSFGPLAFEGHGCGNAIYILRQHRIQEEETLRETLRVYDQSHGLRPHPFLALSTADLLAMLEPKEDNDDAG